jgi:chromosome segregation ATPase
MSTEEVVGADDLSDLIDAGDSEKSLEEMTQKYAKLDIKFKKVKAAALKLKEKCEALEAEAKTKEQQINKLIDVQNQILKELDTERTAADRFREVVLSTQEQLLKKEDALNDLERKNVALQDKHVELEARLKEKDRELGILADRALEQKQLYKLEERAISAAFYEIGLELHSRIHTQRQETTSNSWLSKHRDRLL